LRQALRLRNLDDHLARPGEAQFIARDFLDLVRIGPQLSDFLFQRGVFFIQLVQTRLHFPDFILRAPHRQVAMRPENIVHAQDKQEQPQERAPVLLQQPPDFFVGFYHVPFFKTHAASRANFAYAARPPAST